MVGLRINARSIPSIMTVWNEVATSLSVCSTARLFEVRSLTSRHRAQCRDLSTLGKVV